MIRGKGDRRYFLDLLEQLEDLKRPQGLPRRKNSNGKGCASRDGLVPPELTPDLPRTNPEF